MPGLRLQTCRMFAATEARNFDLSIGVCACVCTGVFRCLFRLKKRRSGIYGWFGKPCGLDYLNLKHTDTHKAIQFTEIIVSLPVHSWILGFWWVLVLDCTAAAKCIVRRLLGGFLGPRAVYI